MQVQPRLRRSKMWPCCPKFNGTGAVCSNHGECVFDTKNKTHGRCECAMGWEGEFCETEACEMGKSANGEMEQCSGRAKGICVNSKCYCRDGWMQGNCEKPSCPGDCNGHGRCNPDTSRCHCEHGWMGEGCNEQACCDPTCSGNGKCMNGTCVCTEGWYGMSCESRSKHKAQTHICEKMQYCNKHGECDEANEKCLCDINTVTNEPLWKGRFCEIPVCHRDCSGNGKCAVSSDRLKGVYSVTLVGAEIIARNVHAHIHVVITVTALTVPVSATRVSLALGVREERAQIRAVDMVFAVTVACALVSTASVA